MSCNDEFAHNHDFGDPISTISESEPHSHEGTVDDCSPFCSCQCCQVNLNVHNLDTFDLSLPIISTKVFTFSYNVTQEFTYSIFQPPQV